MVFANVVGSIINDILPSGVILSLLMALILVGIGVNVYNVVKRYKKESKNIKKLERKKRREKKLKNNEPLSDDDMSTSNNEQNSKV